MIIQTSTLNLQRQKIIYSLGSLYVEDYSLTVGSWISTFIHYLVFIHKNSAGHLSVLIGKSSKVNAMLSALAKK